jgi:APA family basic amino acid/polyamine antiporter
MGTAWGSSAPIGDMMVILGNSFFGPGGGRTFMLCEAFTVFLAIIATTLSRMNTGARVTYAMGKDDEVPEHFAGLHRKSKAPPVSVFPASVN